MREVDGVFLRPGIAEFALGLCGFESPGVLFDGALDAIGLEGDALETFGGIDPGLGLRGDGGDVRLLGFNLGEEGVFHGVGTDEAPAVGGDILREVFFDGTDGGEGFAECAAVLGEGLLFAGEGGVDFSAESVD